MTLAVMLCSASTGKKVQTLGDATMAEYDEFATVTGGLGVYLGGFLLNGWS